MDHPHVFCSAQDNQREANHPEEHQDTAGNEQKYGEHTAGTLKPMCIPPGLKKGKGQKKEGRCQDDCQEGADHVRWTVHRQMNPGEGEKPVKCRNHAEGVLVSPDSGGRCEPFVAPVGESCHGRVSHPEMKNLNHENPQPNPWVYIFLVLLKESKCDGHHA